MKFAHMADCHIGSWRDPKLKDISTRAFEKAIDTCIKEKVDFIIIAGDLFNTAVPRIDNLKDVVTCFRKLKDRNIAVYIVPGSHDYSASGKTMLDVLEEAGLFINVVKGEDLDGKLKLHFTIDAKTGAKITGMLGRRNSLEKQYYHHLSSDHLDSETGYKIFIFHSGIDELKPAEMQNVISQPLSLLPKGFDYYAGGHVHIVEQKQIEGYGMITYPGPLFPNSFAELEKLERGGFYIVENNKAIWHPVQLYNIYKIHKDCSGMDPSQVTDAILQEIKKKEFNDTLVLIRLFGTLSSGNPSQIDFKRIFDELHAKSAYFVMRNTSALQTKEFEEIKIDAESVEDAEHAIIHEHLGQIPLENISAQQESNLVKELMQSLLIEKQEGETVSDFEGKIKEHSAKLLNLKLQ